MEYNCKYNDKKICTDGKLILSDMHYHLDKTGAEGCWHKDLTIDDNYCKQSCKEFKEL